MIFLSFSETSHYQGKNFFIKVSLETNNNYFFDVKIHVAPTRSRFSIVGSRFRNINILPTSHYCIPITLSQNLQNLPFHTATTIKYIHKCVQLNKFSVELFYSSGPGTIKIIWANIWSQISLLQKEYIMQKGDWVQKLARLTFMAPWPDNSSGRGK